VAPFAAGTGSGRADPCPGSLPLPRPGASLRGNNVPHAPSDHRNVRASSRSHASAGTPRSGHQEPGTFGPARAHASGRVAFASCKANGRRGPCPWLLAGSAPSQSDVSLEVASMTGAGRGLLQRRPRGRRCDCPAPPRRRPGPGSAPRPARTPPTTAHAPTSTDLPERTHRRRSTSGRLQSTGCCGSGTSTLDRTGPVAERGVDTRRPRPRSRGDGC